MLQSAGSLAHSLPDVRGDSLGPYKCNIYFTEFWAPLTQPAFTDLLADSTFLEVLLHSGAEAVASCSVLCLTQAACLLGIGWASRYLAYCHDQVSVPFGIEQA